MDLRQRRLAGWREGEIDDASVLTGLLPPYETRRFRAPHELRHRALGQLELLAQLADRRGLTASGGALDHEEEQVPAGREAVAASGVLADAQEPAQRGAELGHALIIGHGEACLHSVGHGAS